MSSDLPVSTAPSIGVPPPALPADPVSTAEALAFFDRLPALEAEAMLGRWQGSSFPTGHPLDGLLEACHWHGKRFESMEAVHPLVFTTVWGGQVCLNPAWMPMRLVARWRIPGALVLGRLFQLVAPLLATRRPRARLRMMTHRGQHTATMIYDALPINDVFRRVDENTVLGFMDHKGMDSPFFFLLRRL